MAKLFAGQLQRPDLEAIVASGLFEECACGLASFAAAGMDGLSDVDHGALFCVLCILRNCRQQPGAEARIRSLAPALRWCLEHDLDVIKQVGMTTGSYAAQICKALRAASMQYSCTCCTHHVPRKHCRLWCVWAR